MQFIRNTFLISILSLGIITLILGVAFFSTALIEVQLHDIYLQSPKYLIAIVLFINVFFPLNFNYYIFKLTLNKGITFLYGISSLALFIKLLSIRSEYFILNSFVSNSNPDIDSMEPSVTTIQIIESILNLEILLFGLSILICGRYFFLSFKKETKTTL